jgi:hypothetical protein
MMGKNNKTRGRRASRKKRRVSKKRRPVIKAIASKEELAVLRCSPKLPSQKNGFSCYDNEALHKLKDMWNKKNRDKMIVTNDSKEIWETLNSSLGDVCKKESCWLKQPFVKDAKVKRELKDSFAPVSPDEWKKNPSEWLSSLDILDVMKQYEKIYKCFKFLGPSPIDYDVEESKGQCVWDDLCHFNLEKEMKQGKFKFGISFNTDPHDKEGEHWISMFINARKGTIFFFDSAGDPAPKEVKRFAKMVKAQGAKLKTPITFVFDQNHPVEHQYGESECGIYSLYFIVHLLEDKHTEEYFKTHVLSDKYMKQFRKIYFNDSL